MTPAWGDWTIDYRCNNRRFWLSAHNCQVPTPTSQNLYRTRAANSDFYSWLTYELLGRLRSTNPNLQIYLPKNANSEKLGLGIDNSCRKVILSLRMNKCLEMVNGRSLDSATHQYQDLALTQEFSFIVTSIVYGLDPHLNSCVARSLNFILGTQIWIRNCWLNSRT